MMTDEPVLLSSIDGAVATLTMNRPQSRNALNIDLMDALRDGIADADANDDVSAIVLTGTDPAFCAGLDLKALADGSQTLGGRTAPGGVATPFGPTTKPVVGAVNGAAVTGGLEIALACDFLIASERAVFADTHARVGVMPGWGLSVRLPLAIGYGRAKQMSFTGNFVDAPQALSWGLVNEVVAHSDVVSRAQQLAADIATIPAASLARYRQVYEQGADLEAALLQEGKASASFQFDRKALAANRESIVSRGRDQT